MSYEESTWKQRVKTKEFMFSLLVLLFFVVLAVLLVLPHIDMSGLPTVRDPAEPLPPAEERVAVVGLVVLFVVLIITVLWANTRHRKNLRVIECFGWIIHYATSCTPTPPT